mgnify:CR=1 FL=1
MHQIKQEKDYQSLKMKKLVLFMAAAVAVAFASCGAKEAAAEEEAAPAVEEVVVEEVAAPADSVVVEEVAAEAAAEVVAE